MHKTRLKSLMMYQKTNTHVTTAQDKGKKTIVNTIKI